MNDEPLSIVDEGPMTPNWGIAYLTPLRVELPPDRPMHMVVLEPLAVADTRTRQNFAVPVGFLSDGASFPPIVRALLWLLFWLAGGSLQGRYRRAAVLHDWECVQQTAVTRTSAIAHERFYRAMRSDGVGYRLAKAMQIAVERYGPRWPR